MNKIQIAKELAKNSHALFGKILREYIDILSFIDAVLIKHSVKINWDWNDLQTHTPNYFISCLQDLDNCISYIEHSKFDISGWQLYGTKYLTNIFYFFNQLKNQQFVLEFDEEQYCETNRKTRKIIPTYSNRNLGRISQEANSIEEAIEKGCTPLLFINELKIAAELSQNLKLSCHQMFVDYIELLRYLQLNIDIKCGTEVCILGLAELHKCILCIENNKLDISNWQIVDIFNNYNGFVLYNPRRLEAFEIIIHDNGLNIGKAVPRYITDSRPQKTNETNSIQEAIKNCTSINFIDKFSLFSN